ncbi:chemotaxis protein CheW [Sphingomonas aurantiaca]
MDVVRANIEQIGGRIVLTNDPGRGLRIVIHVPLTLSILSTIIVGVGAQRFALPRQAIEEIVMVRGNQVRIETIGDAATVTVRGKRMPLVSLGELLDLNGDLPPTLVIVSTREGDYALGVDTVLDTEEARRQACVARGDGDRRLCGQDIARQRLADAVARCRRDRRGGGVAVHARHRGGGGGRGGGAGGARVAVRRSRRPAPGDRAGGDRPCRAGADRGDPLVGRGAASVDRRDDHPAPRGRRTGCAHRGGGVAADRWRKRNGLCDRRGDRDRRAADGYGARTRHRADRRRGHDRGRADRAWSIRMRCSPGSR